MAPYQYALFAGHCFYPSGGASDLRAIGTISELKQMYAKSANKWSKEIGGYPDPWGHIASLPSLKIVLEAGSVGEWKDTQDGP